MARVSGSSVLLKSKKSSLYFPTQVVSVKMHPARLCEVPQSSFALILECLGINDTAMVPKSGSLSERNCNAGVSCGGYR